MVSFTSSIFSEWYFMIALQTLSVTIDLNAILYYLSRAFMYFSRSLLAMSESCKFQSVDCIALTEAKLALTLTSWSRYFFAMSLNSLISESRVFNCA